VNDKLPFVAWPVGSEVVVRTLGNKRGVVIEVSRSGRYRVQVDGVMTSCRGVDLAAAPSAKVKKRTGRARLEHPATTAGADAAPPGRVDLHGLRVEDAIARVLDEIDHALRRGADRLEVIHGKGSGRVKDALHRRLAELSVVAAFRIDPRNSGITWVYF
jgi:DNA mismatch repair protein MutS2